MTDIRKMDFLPIQKKIVCASVKYIPVGMLIDLCVYYTSYMPVSSTFSTQLYQT